MTTLEETRNAVRALLSSDDIHAGPAPKRERSAKDELASSIAEKAIAALQKAILENLPILSVTEYDYASFLESTVKFKISDGRAVIVTLTEDKS
jgi:hypothetical protein